MPDYLLTFTEALLLIVALLTLLAVVNIVSLKRQHQQQSSGGQQQNELQQQALKNYFEQQVADLRLKQMRQQQELASKQEHKFHLFSQEVLKHFAAQQSRFDHNQAKAVDQLIDHLNKVSQANREELTHSLSITRESLTARFDKLTESTDQRLKGISEQVEQRLVEGFDKTTKTFNDILKRLALIDDAQKKITELSSNVVSLQEVLNDKRSRGAFGEVQLNALIRNTLPEGHFAIQQTLSNKKIADCILYLPAPTGNVVIDAKFPLENYQRMMNVERSPEERKQAERQFKADIKKHINDIREKYIIENETADGAVMFIPAEAVFAEIHAHQSELVEYANKSRVWLASPTTLMAILTTARSVIKDQATRQQIHIIQAHLSELSQDFGRFRGRFANLARHIDQAARDVQQIHTSADKISDRFEKIEQVELSTTEQQELQLTKKASA